MNKALDQAIEDFSSMLASFHMTYGDVDEYKGSLNSLENLEEFRTEYEAQIHIDKKDVTNLLPAFIKSEKERMKQNFSISNNVVVSTAELVADKMKEEE